MSAQPSAVVADGRDSGVPWHFGDPLREQRLLARGVGVVDRRNRDVLQVSGPERLPWLHSICSQHLTTLADGDATEALVLSPHGHVEQHWQLAELGAAVWIDTEPGAAVEVLRYLRAMQFLKRVESVDVSARWAVLSVIGPRAADALAAAGLPVDVTPGRAARIASGGFVRSMPWPAPAAYDVIVPRSDADTTIDAVVAAGAARAGLWAFEALRVESRRPRLGLETDHRTIAHEVGWIGGAVHLDKGCYRGQETVARVQNLGKPPRRLVMLHFAGESDELPSPGTPVEHAGRVVGFLGTAVHHHELGPVGLAVIKRTLPASADLQVGGHVARADSDPAAA